MKPRTTALAASPDGGQALARDMRVRWALEQPGQDHDVILVPSSNLTEPEHRARQPFGHSRHTRAR